MNTPKPETEKTMTDISLRDLLVGCKKYIEVSEEQIDNDFIAAPGEWGSCRNVKELIAANAMPELYWQVLAWLKKRGG